ncbi:hypothetical protein CHARACLAT_011004 [Characodon lateralis]|uniref:Uncharacterized protein n=1 Tax=Characodon lateralis TaxID=208331 RepID=A0ABU7CRJ7_9TELE|nr:hypothetical protein [Characodon lateralis]
MFVHMHVCETEIKSRVRVTEDLGPSDISPACNPLQVSSCFNNSQSGHCSLPSPRSHHNAVISRVTLQHTTLFHVLSCFFFPLVSFSEQYSHVKPPLHLSSQSHTKRSLSV